MSNKYIKCGDGEDVDGGHIFSSFWKRVFVRLHIHNSRSRCATPVAALLVAAAIAKRAFSLSVLLSISAYAGCKISSTIQVEVEGGAKKSLKEVYIITVIKTKHTTLPGKPRTHTARAAAGPSPGFFGRLFVGGKMNEFMRFRLVNHLIKHVMIG